MRDRFSRKEVTLMPESAVVGEVTQKLTQLPLHYQRRVLTLVDTLSTSTLRGTPGSELLRFAGTVPADDLQRIGDAVELGCGRVDTDEW